MVDALQIEAPAATYYPSGHLNDQSNWWGPNIACVLGMLHRVGFQAARLETIWDINTVDKVREVFPPPMPNAGGQERPRGVSRLRPRLISSR